MIIIHLANVTFLINYTDTRLRLVEFMFYNRAAKVIQNFVTCKSLKTAYV